MQEKFRHFSHHICFVFTSCQKCSFYLHYSPERDENLALSSIWRSLIICRLWLPLDAHLAQPLKPVYMRKFSSALFLNPQLLIFWLDSMKFSHSDYLSSIVHSSWFLTHADCMSHCDILAKTIKFPRQLFCFFLFFSLHHIYSISNLSIIFINRKL